MLGRVRSVLCLAAFVVFTGQFASCAETTKGSVSTTASTSNRPSTCPSATVNYITHGLPQQCLRTNRTASVTTYSRHGNPTDSSAATVQVVTNSTALSSTSDSVSATSPTGHVESTDPATPSQDTQSSPASGADPISSSQSDGEHDSPLDHARFLSFEEWKKENLAQAGQSAETVNEGHTASVPGEHRQRPGNDNALDALGDDSEIELDFSGFGDSARPSAGKLKDDATPPNPAAGGDGASDEAASAAPRHGSKDAGKTSKERFNYASFDCAANVLKTNPRCKSSSSVLVENKDSYMLNECSADNKFLIVELCDLIWIDTVVLANFEFFSSIFRKFRVSVSDRYPVKIDKWKELGTYEARNTRDIQPFLVEDPPIWARYLRIEFLTHYGNEFYCPLSLLRVHGTTMFEQFRRDQAIDRGDFDPNDEEEEEEAEGATAVAKQAETKAAESAEPKPSEESVPSSAPTVSEPAKAEAVGSGSVEASPSQTATTSQGFQSAPTETARKCPVSNTNPPALATDALNGSLCHTGEHTARTQQSPTGHASNASIPATTDSILPSSSTTASDDNDKSGSSKAQTVEGSTSMNATSSDLKPTDTSSNATSKTKPSSVGSTLMATPIAAHAGAVAPAPPGTQESFFKSIHKRLQALEANATLSLQYIESQSQLLRDAFAKVEKRQLLKTSEFLNTLNATVLTELSRFKGEYEQLWQSTVLELANQRDEGRREREILGERVKVLAEEMVSQRRLMAVQATILLLCLGLVVFGRVNTGGAVDVGFVQSVQGLVAKANRNQQRGWKWDSPWTSPSSKRGTLRPETSSEAEPMMRHARSASEDSIDLSELQAASPASQQCFGAETPLSGARSAPATPTAAQSSQNAVYLNDSHDSATQSYDSLNSV